MTITDCLPTGVSVALYTGNWSVGSVDHCQAWNSQSPNRHGYTDPAMFPDDTIEDAANSCRAVDAAAPWCFVMKLEGGWNFEGGWNYCWIPECQQTGPY
jgi:hypothetical protein